ncbi:MAG: hypothetical protein FWD71_05625 [Oscillospiraceae bacterium]|nr:hypothetical protein [Oscillospiraceae bacterium]
MILNIIKKAAVILLIISMTCNFLVLQSCNSNNSSNDATTAQDTTNATTIEDITTTEATTPAPTEPPTTKPSIKTEEISKWTFTADSPVFKIGNQSANLTVTDGILKVTSTGGDPFLFTVDGNLGINASDVNYIKFKIKNDAEGYDNQLFFITNDDTTWSEDKSIRNEYMYDEGQDWEILEFDTSDCDLWDGIIKQLRFDYLTEEGDVEIEYVSLEKIAQQ